jgi:hypothetical protein
LPQNLKKDKLGDYDTGRREFETYVHGEVLVISPLSLAPDLGFDALTDGQLACTLTDFCEVGPRVTMGHLCNIAHVNILSKNIII